MSKHKFLAFDLGASSGRGIIGTLENNKIELKEVNRFYNGMTFINGQYFWDIFRLYDEIKQGLVQCVNEGEIPESIALDTWGVDYALLDEKGNILQIPYAYRDHRTDTAIDELDKIIPKSKIYELTGIQFLQFNTIFQLYAAVRDKLPVMKLAKSLLFVPDIFNYFLSGVQKSEFTFATTSQLYNPKKKTWEPELFKAIGVDINIMQEIAQPGSVIGTLTEHLQAETGLPAVDVVASASHDTGSAIVSIPAVDEDFAYISSGTWSLMGIESKTPLITEETLANNLTNEGGVEGTFRVLKNIMGLWLIQECRKCWSKAGNEFSFPELVKMSESSTPFKILIDPDDSSFLNPADMATAISDYAKAHNQPAFENEGEFARCIYESLAFAYRYTLETLIKASGKKISRIHIIGGGSQNELLCQFAANATGLPVVAGPAEGTALGNIMMQAYAKGHVKSLAEIRQVIRNSFDFKEFTPKDTDAWNAAYNKFLTLKQS